MDRGRRCEIRGSLRIASGLVREAGLQREKADSAQKQGGQSLESPSLLAGWRELMSTNGEQCQLPRL